MRALFDVAVSSLRPSRRYTQHDNLLAAGSQLNSRAKHLDEAFIVIDDMVRRENPDHCVRRIRLQQKRRQRTRRGRIPCRRLAQNVLTRHLWQLLRNRLVQKAVGNHPDIFWSRQWTQTIQCLLNHCAFAVQRQYLLSARLPAPWPEPRPTASCEDDGRKARPRSAC